MAYTLPGTVYISARAFFEKPCPGSSNSKFEYETVQAHLQWYNNEESTHLLSCMLYLQRSHGSHPLTSGFYDIVTTIEHRLGRGNFTGAVLQVNTVPMNCAEVLAPTVMHTRATVSGMLSNVEDLPELSTVTISVYGEFVEGRPTTTLAILGFISPIA